MTRLDIAKQELAPLENQLREIEKNFGRGLAPVELEQRIFDLRDQINSLIADENRKENFITFCEAICLAAGLHKVANGEFRKKELYDAEIAIKYDEDDDPEDEFRLCICTAADYSIGEITVRYKRILEDRDAKDAQRVVFKITEESFAFNEEAFRTMLKFIRANASESVSYLREAELKWTVNQLRSTFAKKGLAEEDWTPAESELNLG